MANNESSVTFLYEMKNINQNHVFPQYKSNVINLFFLREYVLLTLYTKRIFQIFIEIGRLSYASVSFKEESFGGKDLF